MARHTYWDKWMTENIRYALMHNRLCFSQQVTFSEYPYYKTISGGISYIDVVGKRNIGDSLAISTVVEIKSSMSDFRSGKGRNFVGKYNFFATDNDFAEQLLYEIKKDPVLYKNVGLLVVQPDGKVHTILESIFKSERYSIKSDFNQFSTDEEVESYFKNTEVPHQKANDMLKQYPVETVVV